MGWNMFAFTLGNCDIARIIAIPLPHGFTHCHLHTIHLECVQFTWFLKQRCQQPHCWDTIFIWFFQFTPPFSYTEVSCTEAIYMLTPAVIYPSIYHYAKKLLLTVYWICELILFRIFNTRCSPTNHRLSITRGSVRPQCSSSVLPRSDPTRTVIVP